MCIYLCYCCGGTWKSGLLLWSRVTCRTKFSGSTSYFCTDDFPFGTSGRVAWIFSGTPDHVADFIVANFGTDTKRYSESFGSVSFDEGSGRTGYDNAGNLRSGR